MTNLPLQGAGGLPFTLPAGVLGEGSGFKDFRLRDGPEILVVAAPCALGDVGWIHYRSVGDDIVIVLRHLHYLDIGEILRSLHPSVNIVHTVAFESELNETFVLISLHELIVDVLRLQASQMKK